MVSREDSSDVITQPLPRINTAARMKAAYDKNKWISELFSKETVVLRRWGGKSMFRLLAELMKQFDYRKEIECWRLER